MRVGRVCKMREYFLLSRKFACEGVRKENSISHDKLEGKALTWIFLSLCAFECKRVIFILMLRRRKILFTSSCHFPGITFDFSKGKLFESVTLTYISLSVCILGATMWGVRENCYLMNYFILYYNKHFKLFFQNLCSRGS